MLSRQCTKVGIVGGRDFIMLQYAIISLLSVFRQKGIMFSTLARDNNHITIVSGGARGADEIGKMIATSYNTNYEEYPAEWENLEKQPCSIKTRPDGTKYNKLAGFNRNQDIVDNSDFIIAFWDLKSRGTEDTIRRTMKSKKEVFIYYYEGEEL